jgi:hypothetical protein
MASSLVVVEGQTITWVRDLSVEEHEKLKKASCRLMQHFNDQHPLAIVALNYEDLQNQLQKLAREYEADPSMNWIRMEMMRLMINRHILNFLSAARMFLDHSEYNLKKRYGQNSNRLERFKNACSSAYDAQFSYRFMYELRNYSQHCDMPLGTLQLQSKSREEDSRTVERSLRISFDRDKLLKDHDWKAELRAEIQNLPSEFEINSHIHQMMDCLVKINLTLLEEDLKELDESVEAIDNLTKSTKEIGGRPFMAEGAPRGDEKKLKMSLEWIPLELVDLVRNLRSAQQPSRLLP